MNFFKRHWNNLISYIKFNKKTIQINILIFFITITILLIIDLVTKHTLFNKIEYKNWLFGIRSVENPGLTFIPSLETNVGLITFFNIIILLCCLVSVIFVRPKIFIMFIGFIFSGSLGNSIDRLAFYYVRDIIYIPWFDRGTFNFADVDVVVGSFGIFFAFVYFYFKSNPIGGR